MYIKEFTGFKISQDKRKLHNEGQVILLDSELREGGVVKEDSLRVIVQIIFDSHWVRGNESVISDINLR